MKINEMTSPNYPRIKVIGVCGEKKQTDPTGVYVNTTSRCNSPLSPFKLGPCSLYGTKVSKRMENGYQYSKVWSEHIGPDGLPTPDYFKWSDEGFDNKKPVRYPMGEDRKRDYKFHYWDGKMISRIEGRKMIYVPLYYQSVIKTEKYRELKQTWGTIQKNGHGTLYLMEFDDYPTEGMSLSEILNNPDQSLGHGQVLKMMLLNDPCLIECHLRTESKFVTCVESVTPELTELTPELQELIETVKTLHSEILETETRITSLKVQSLKSGIQIGEHLTQCKRSVKHGLFGRFIEVHLKDVMTHRTCNRYMVLFKRKDELDETVVSIRSAYIKLGLLSENPSTTDLTFESQTLGDSDENLVEFDPSKVETVENPTEEQSTVDPDDSTKPSGGSKHRKYPTSSKLELVMTLDQTFGPIFDTKKVSFYEDSGRIKTETHNPFTKRPIKGTGSSGGIFEKNERIIEKLLELLKPYVEWYQNEMDKKDPNPNWLQELNEETKQTPIELTEPTEQPIAA